MSIIAILLPLALLLAITSVAAFAWSVLKGQYDDLDTPAHRILFNDESERKRK
jgi:cbb3-type cytochrome oxidase maturation protein